MGDINARTSAGVWLPVKVTPSTSSWSWRVVGPFQFIAGVVRRKVVGTRRTVVMAIVGLAGVAGCLVLIRALLISWRRRRDLAKFLATPPASGASILQEHMLYQQLLSNSGVKKRLLPVYIPSRTPKSPTWARRSSPPLELNSDLPPLSRTKLKLSDSPKLPSTSGSVTPNRSHRGSRISSRRHHSASPPHTAVASEPTKPSRRANHSSGSPNPHRNSSTSSKEKADVSNIVPDWVGTLVQESQKPHQPLLHLNANKRQRAMSTSEPPENYPDTTTSTANDKTTSPTPESSPPTSNP
ncbi:hypothetical protein Pelo_9843 [Pelomyxa schiedti]|nr:hypothetical protein Pelo_9843 [Pelomyxa schiedti]